MKKLISFFGLIAALGVGACDGQQKSTRDCSYDGNERYGITVDGRFRGAFETYIPAEGPHGIAFFRNGLIPASGDLRSAPDEAKDVTVFSVQKGKVTGGVADLVATRFISFSGLPAKDDSGCLVVDEIAVEVGQTQDFSGVLTGSATSHDASAADSVDQTDED